MFPFYQEHIIPYLESLKPCHKPHPEPKKLFYCTRRLNV